MQIMETLNTLGEDDPLIRSMVKAAGANGLREIVRKLEELEAQADKAGFLQTPTVVDDLRRQPNGRDSGPSFDLICTVGSYCLIRQIGRGGFGRVFEGYHQDFPDRKVAVKVYENGWLDDVERLEIEKLVVQKLQHPNLITAIDWGNKADGTPYLVMNLVEGIRIDQFVEQQQLGFEQIARLFGQIAEGMEYAHTQDVVHRDLKPSNILITAESVPVVTDFGLAKRLKLEGDRSLTATGALVGTLGYLAPEQADAKRPEVTRAVDVYGLGATLYHVLTGHAPFERENLLKALDELKTRAPVSPRSFNPAVPPDLERVCLKCMEKLPHDRYDSMQALAEDLQRFIDGKPVLARSRAWHQRWWRWCCANPLIGGLSIGLGVAVLSGLVVSTIFWWRAVAEQQQAAGLLAMAQEILQSGDEDAESILIQSAGLLQYRHERLIKSVQFMDDLVEQYPGNDELYRGSATSWFRLGKVCCRREMWEEGLVAYETAIERFRKLAEKYPEDDCLQFDVCHSLLGIDNVDRDFLGQPLEEEGKLAEAYDLIQRLVADNPTNTDYRDAQICIQGTISFRRFPSDSLEAIEFLESTYQDAVRLKSEFPEPCLQWRHVGTTAYRIAEVHLVRGELDQSEAWLQIALTEINEFLKRPDRDPQEVLDLAACFYLGHRLELKKNDFQKADHYGRQLRELLEKCVEDYPDHSLFHEMLSQCIKNLADRN